jgi:hypothetical protein
MPGSHIYEGWIDGTARHRRMRLDDYFPKDAGEDV